MTTYNNILHTMICICKIREHTKAEKNFISRIEELPPKATADWKDVLKANYFLSAV